MYSTPAVIAHVGIPKSPSNIHIRQLNNSFVEFFWSEGLNFVGLSTVRYRVELIAVVTNEVQIISISSKGALNGNFEIGFNNSKTIPIPISSDENKIESALTALPDAVEMKVEKLCSEVGHHEWRVTLISSVNELPLLTIDTSMLQGQLVTTNVNSNDQLPSFDKTSSRYKQINITNEPEVQAIVLSASAQDLEGTFVLHFMEESSIPVSVSLSDDEM